MPRYVGLLRAVNVGSNQVSMAALRTLFESLGHSDVSTYIQSGNIVFTARKAVTPASLERAIADQLGVTSPVVLRTPAQLRAAVAANPFPRADTSKLHVGFMARAPLPSATASFDRERFAPEEFAIHGCELYLHLPNGMGRSKLPAALDRQLKVPTTVRNWNTVTKLVELAGR